LKTSPKLSLRKILLIFNLWSQP